MEKNIRLSPGWWSVSLFCQAIKEMIDLTPMWTEMNEHDGRAMGQFKTTVSEETRAKHEQDVTYLVFSKDLNDALGITEQNLRLTHYDSIDFSVEMFWDTPNPAITLILPKKVYVTIHDLIDALNKSIANALLGDWILWFTLLSQQNGESAYRTKVQHRFQSNTWKINLSHEVFYRLGLSVTNSDDEWLTLNSKLLRNSGKPHDKIPTIGNLMYTTSLHDAGIGMPAFWIFTDIIEDQIVGNTLKPLLCIVPNNTQDTKYWIENVDPHYVSVRNRKLSSINIKICNSDDENHVTQLDGITTVILHFRKI